MKRYRGEAVEVIFDAGRCLHAAECLRGLPEVFDTARRPWVLPDAAAASRVAEVVRRCPTGALHYALSEGPPERGERPTAVSAEPEAPLWLRGDLRLRLPYGGELAETRAALCRCGRTSNGPFCDGSGDCTGWHERRRHTEPVREATAPPERRT